MQDGQHLTVIAHAEITKEEHDVEAGVKKTLGDKGRLYMVWGNTMYERDQLPFRPDMSDLNDVFTNFRNKVRACKCSLTPVTVCASHAAAFAPSSCNSLYEVKEHGCIGSMQRNRDFKQIPIHLLEQLYTGKTYLPGVCWQWANKRRS